MSPSDDELATVQAEITAMGWVTAGATPAVTTFVDPVTRTVRVESDELTDDDVAELVGRYGDLVTVDRTKQPRRRDGRADRRGRGRPRHAEEG